MLGNGSVGEQLEDLPAIHPHKHDILQTQAMTIHVVVFNYHRYSVDHEGVDAVEGDRQTACKHLDHVRALSAHVWAQNCITMVHTIHC